MGVSRGRQLLGGVLLAGFGVGCALLALEAGVRLLHLVPDRFWRPDALLGTALISNAEGWWTQEEHEFFTPVRINAAGRRDLERSETKADGAFRILLLGDSFVEALQVPIESTFARGLERILKLPDGKPVEVVSMGVSGYGTASQYLWYRDVGRRFRPDLVILSFYPGNDVRNNSPVLEPTLRPVYSADGTLERVQSGKGGDGAPGGLLGRSAAYQYLRKLVLTRQPAMASWLADLGIVNRAALRPAPLHEGVPVDYWVFSSRPPPDWDDAWRRTEALLDGLNAAVRHDGAQLVVMIVTAREQVYPDDWTALQHAYPAMRDLPWDLDGPERRVTVWCAQAGVTCVPMSAAFRAAREAGGERLHWHFDGHWTAAGHALAARTMAHALSQPAQRPAAHWEAE